MVDKKGFTMVELLVVIAVMGLIMILAVPSVTSVNKRVRGKMLDTKIKLAEESLLLWGQDNKKCFTGMGVDCIFVYADACSVCTLDSTAGHCCNVTLGALAENNLIEYDENGKVINPVNNNDITNQTISIFYNTSNKTLKITGNSLSS